MFECSFWQNLHNGFDDNIVITFSTSFLGSPVSPNLDFMNHAATPQSKFFAPGDTFDPAGPSQQGQPLESKPK